MEIKEFLASEQETTVFFERITNEMIIYTSDSTVITKLKKIYPIEQIQVLTVNRNGNASSIKIVTKKNLITFRKP